MDFNYKKNGRSSSTVEVSLLHFWEARSVRRDGDLMGVDIVKLFSPVNFYRNIAAMNPVYN